MPRDRPVDVLHAQPRKLAIEIAGAKRTGAPGKSQSQDGHQPARKGQVGKDQGARRAAMQGPAAPVRGGRAALT